jgi:cytoskeletal protein CcmA (bactofilin family)
MTNTEFRPAEPNTLYVGAGVTIKGTVSTPDLLVVDGTVEGDVTARAIRIGASGVVRGQVVASEAEVHGLLADKVEIRDLLHVRTGGRIEGNLNCGDVQVDRGAVLAGGVFTASPPAQKEAARQEIAPPPPEDVKQEPTPPTPAKTRLFAAE